MTEESNNTPEELTDEQKKKLKDELQKQFYKVKKKLKIRSKSELIAMIWEQGIAYKQLQDIAQEMHKELQSLKGEPDVKENSESPE